MVHSCQPTILIHITSGGGHRPEFVIASYTNLRGLSQPRLRMCFVSEMAGNPKRKKSGLAMTMEVAFFFKVIFAKENTVIFC